MTKFGIGQPVPRTEDARLLRGEGRYTDDIARPGQLHLHLLRSPHAHAEVVSIDLADALAAPGVVAIYTAADLAKAGVGPIPCVVPLRNRDGSSLAMKPRPVLAADRVRHVGDPIAAIVAESPAQARDAAELIVVDYTPMEAVVGTEAALGSPALVWDDVPANRCFDWEMGDAAAVESAFAKADRTVALDLVNNRLVANSLEPRGCMAEPDPDGRTRIWVTSQGVHFVRQMLAATLGLEEKQFQVLTTDVGGGFGMKLFVYPEYILAAFAARALTRPVKWTAERGEAFLSDDQGRDNVTRAELAVDREGRFLGLRVRTVANMGAYLSNYAPYIPTEAGAPMLAGVYRTPAIHVAVQGVFTHTTPVDAYRGAGRPEAAYLVERLVDAAARELGVDPAELRRRNVVPPDAMPYRTPLKYTYDSDDFARCLDLALERADRAGFPERRRWSLAEGRLRGFGFATYIEACSGGGGERATLQMAPDGTVTLLIGTQSNGQGHETAYAQVLADRMGIPLETIRVVQGDSDRIATGGGTGGSRSIPVGGAAVAASAEKLVETMRLAAAELLEAAAVDVEFAIDDQGGLPGGGAGGMAGGGFRVVGTDRRLSVQEVAAQAPARDDGLAFQEAAKWTPPANTFPNGCHVCELEVEIDTGRTRILRYTVVDDFGTVLNPLLLAGQVHGGIVQGVGQALTEDTVFDPETGQLLTGSFMDYAMPRADILPSVDFHLAGTPCTTNALGMKGAGEAGAIGAPPAVINALVDALAAYDVRHIDMPATPEKLWRLIHRRQAPAAAA